MKQIFCKDTAILITDKEVIEVNYPSTIFTNDDVVVSVGKDRKEVHETLTEAQIKIALTKANISYAKESKDDLVKKLDVFLNEKIDSFGITADDKPDNDMTIKK